MISALIERLRREPALPVICLLFIIAGALRINDLNLYNPDSARYLIWANAVAHFKGFVDDTMPDAVGYVMNAPFFAVLLAPVHWIAPLSVTASKLAAFAFSLVTLALFYAFFRKTFSPFVAGVALAVFAFNPATLVYATEVLSELPFTALVLGLLILTERMDAAPAHGRREFIGVLILLAISPLLREVGTVMILAMVVFFFLKKDYKRLMIAAAVPLAVALLWQIRNQVIVGVPAGWQVSNLSLTLQHFVTPSETSIVYELSMRAWKNIQAYSMLIGGMMLVRPVYPEIVVELSGLSSAMNMILYTMRFVIVGIITLLMLAGAAIDLKSDKGYQRVLLTVVFFLVICLYPIYDKRFIYPLVPLFIFFLVRGCVGTGGFLRGIPGAVRASAAVVAAFVMMLGNLAYCGDIIRTNLLYTFDRPAFEKKARAAFGSSFMTQHWEEISSWLKDNTPQDVVIATPDKHLALVAQGRKIVEIDKGVPRPYFETILREMNVDYVLAPTNWGDVLIYEFQMRESERFTFERVAQGGDLYLFRVHSRIIEPSRVTTGLPAADTVNPAGWLRLGRASLMAGDYGLAFGTFLRGLSMSPGNPELMLNAATAAAFMDQSTDAQYFYTALTKTQQALSYLLPGRIQMDALAKLAAADRSLAAEDRSVKINEVAGDYWRAGFSIRANEVSRSLLERDTSYFVGLLWGWHYAFQGGDTARARKYLAQLAAIDPSNNVVRVFSAIQRESDSLKLKLAPGMRSALHRSIARNYAAVELPEAALDAAERSLAVEPNSAESTFLLGELYRGNAMPHAARRWYARTLALEPGHAAAKERLAGLQKGPGQ